jgi:hypothetical protein
MGLNRSLFILVILASFVILCGSGIATAANLIWNPSSGTVDGYKVHYGTSTGNPTETIDVGNTNQYSLDALSLSENTQYYFCVSAYNTAGESEPCAPVAFTPADATPPAPPIGLMAE